MRGYIWSLSLHSLLNGSKSLEVFWYILWLLTVSCKFSLGLWSNSLKLDLEFIFLRKDLYLLLSVSWKLYQLRTTLKLNSSLELCKQEILKQYSLPRLNTIVKTESFLTTSFCMAKFISYSPLYRALGVPALCYMGRTYMLGLVSLTPWNQQKKSSSPEFRHTILMRWQNQDFICTSSFLLTPSQQPITHSVAIAITYSLDYGSSLSYSLLSHLPSS